MVGYHRQGDGGEPPGAHPARQIVIGRGRRDDAAGVAVQVYDRVGQHLIQRAPLSEDAQRHAACHQCGSCGDAAQDRTPGHHVSNSSFLEYLLSIAQRCFSVAIAKKAPALNESAS